MALHWCGHRKDLKPHLMLNQSVEGKEEGGEGTAPNFLSPQHCQQQDLCSIFTFLPWTVTLASPSPTELDELSGIFFTVFW